MRNCLHHYSTKWVSVRWFLPLTCICLVLPEIQMAKRLEELDGVIAGLRNDNLSLHEQLAKESSEKLVRYLDPISASIVYVVLAWKYLFLSRIHQEAIDCHLREKEGRIAAGKLQATLLEDLEKCKQEILAAERQVTTNTIPQITFAFIFLLCLSQWCLILLLYLTLLQIASQKDMYKRLQEYNTSLQQYNSKLQTDLSDSNDSLKRVENEKLSIIENLGGLRSHYSALQEQLTSCKVSLLQWIRSAFCPWKSIKNQGKPKVRTFALT